MSGGAQARLALAFDGATAGRTLLVNGPAELDPALFDPEHSLVVQTDAMIHQALVRRGWNVAVEIPRDELFDVAVVFLPRARAAQRGRVAQAVRCLAPGGTLWVDGQKADGIETMLRDLRQLASVDPLFSKAHGKLFRVIPPEGDWLPDDWTMRPTRLDGGYVTWPGVFSADGPDPASVLLAAALPARMPTRVVELGAGWGWLAGRILTREGIQEVHLVEADHDALRCARENLNDPRLRFHWTDATTFKLPDPVNAVVMNPPFHGSGGAADPRIGTAFVRAAASLLTSAGRLWMVANRHLPYEAELDRHFRQVEEIGGTGAFKVLTATGARRV